MEALRKGFDKWLGDIATHAAAAPTQINKIEKRNPLKSPQTIAFESENEYSEDESEPIDSTLHNLAVRTLEFLGTERGIRSRHNRKLSVLKERFDILAGNFAAHLRRKRKKEFDYNDAIKFTDAYLDFKKDNPTITLSSIIFPRTQAILENINLNTGATVMGALFTMDFAYEEEKALSKLANDFLQNRKLPKEIIAQLHLKKGQRLPEIRRWDETQLVDFLRQHWIPCIVMQRFRQAFLATGVDFTNNPRHLNDSTLEILYSSVTSQQTINHFRQLHNHPTAEDVADAIDDFIILIKIEFISRQFKKIDLPDALRQLLSSFESNDTLSDRPHDPLEAIKQIAITIADALPKYRTNSKERTRSNAATYYDVIKVALLELARENSVDVHEIIALLPREILRELNRPNTFISPPPYSDSEELLACIMPDIADILALQEHDVQDYLKLETKLQGDNESAITSTVFDLSLSFVKQQLRLIIDAVNSGSSKDSFAVYDRIIDMTTIAIERLRIVHAGVDQNWRRGEEYQLRLYVLLHALAQLPKHDLLSLLSVIPIRYLKEIASFSIKQPSENIIQCQMNITDFLDKPSADIDLQPFPFSSAFLFDEKLNAHFHFKKPGARTDHPENTLASPEFMIRSLIEQLLAISAGQPISLRSIRLCATALRKSQPLDSSIRAEIFHWVYKMLFEKSLEKRDAIIEAILKMDFEQVETKIVDRLINSIKSKRMPINYLKGNLLPQYKAHAAHLREMKISDLVELLHRGWIPMITLRTLRDALISGGNDFRITEDSDIVEISEQLQSETFIKGMQQLSRSDFHAAHIIQKIKNLRWKIREKCIETAADDLMKKIRTHVGRYRIDADFNREHSSRKIFNHAKGAVNTYLSSFVKGNETHAYSFDLITWTLCLIENKELEHFLSSMPYAFLVNLWLSLNHLLPKPKGMTEDALKDYNEVARKIKKALIDRRDAIRERDTLAARLKLTHSLPGADAQSDRLRNNLRAISRKLRRLARNIPNLEPATQEALQDTAKNIREQLNHFSIQGDRSTSKKKSQISDDKGKAKNYWDREYTPTQNTITPRKLRNSTIISATPGTPRAPLKDIQKLARLTQQFNPTELQDFWGNEGSSSVYSNDNYSKPDTTTSDIKTDDKSGIPASFNVDPLVTPYT